MLWFAIAVISLLAGAGFLVAGRKFLIKDREDRRGSMSAVTRILHALGFAGIGIACYTIYFWFEDEVFDGNWALLGGLIIICICVGIFWAVVALYYLIAGPLYFGRSKRAKTVETPVPMTAPESVHAQTASNTHAGVSPNAQFCPQCGSALQQGQRFCVSCGMQIVSNVKPTVRVCGFCGEKAEEGLVYCANCGHRL